MDRDAVKDVFVHVATYVKVLNFGKKKPVLEEGSEVVKLLLGFPFEVATGNRKLSRVVVRSVGCRGEGPLPRQEIR